MSPSWLTLRPPVPRALWLTGAFMLLLCCLAAHANAAPPERLLLRAFSVATEGEQIVLRASLDIDDREGMRNILRDGAQVQLTCTATLRRNRTLLPAQEVGGVVAEIVMRHDPLTREFELFTSPDLPPRRDRNFARLLDGTWSRLRLNLAPTAELTPGEGYTVTLTCSLRHTKVPPWLEKTLFFWSWDVVPEATFTQPFNF